MKVMKKEILVWLVSIFLISLLSVSFASAYYIDSCDTLGVCEGGGVCDTAYNSVDCAGNVTCV
jgi:hypothetical protein